MLIENLCYYTNTLQYTNIPFLTFLHSDKEKLGLRNRRVPNEKNYKDKRTGQNKRHLEKKLPSPFKEFFCFLSPFY